MIPTTAAKAGILAGMGALMALASARAGIPVEDIEQWSVEVFAGNRSGVASLYGPRLGNGVPGAMAFDRAGNAYVANVTCVYSISTDGQVRLLAGAPGIAGTADGASDGACFGAIDSLAAGPDGAVYVSDFGHFCIKRIVRDGARWRVETVAGTPGTKGRQDGPGREALLSRPEGLAFDSQGNLYTMDQDWLLRIDKDGRVTTLNPEGGTGKEEDGPLVSARFNRLMGSGAISIDGSDRLYQADLWNNVLRVVDLKTGRVRTLAGAEGKKAWREGMPRSMDGDAAKVARFHGAYTAFYDAVSGRVYSKAVDEDAVRCWCPDGWMRTLGPLVGGKAPLLPGPLKQAKGAVSLLGVDPQGRVYVGQDGIIFRFHRPSARPDEMAGVASNGFLTGTTGDDSRTVCAIDSGKPLEPCKADVLTVSDGKPLAGAFGMGDLSAVAVSNGYVVMWREGGGGVATPSHTKVALLDTSARIRWARGVPFGGDGQVAPAGAWDGRSRSFLLAWQDRRGGHSRIRGSVLPQSSFDAISGEPGAAPDVGEDSIVDITAPDTYAIRPAVASDGKSFLILWHELSAEPDALPTYAVKAGLFGLDGRPISEAATVAVSGANAVVCYDGARYVAAYESSGGGIYAVRLTWQGGVLKSGDPVKMGGQWERRPALAANGHEVVVTGARRPWPNWWGWSGPGAISIGRLGADGATPERFAIGNNAIADGGFAGLLDRAQWKGKKGWPAGCPGGLKGTENGYWPTLYSSVCWDGRGWVAAWVRGRMSGMNLNDLDVFAMRVDPATMMPIGEPLRAGGGDMEAGAQTLPAVASCGDGVSLLAYESAQPNGAIHLCLRWVSGGSSQRRDRVEPSGPKRVE